MPSLANEVSDCVTESELGVGDRNFGQIPFDGGSTGDKGGMEMPGDVQNTHLGNNTPLLDGITTGMAPACSSCEQRASALRLLVMDTVWDPLDD